MDTPLVEMFFSKGYFKIIGKSVPENATNFFNPVLNGLDMYSKNPVKSTTVDFHLEYFNTSSSKYLLDILMLLDSIYSEGNDVKINWYYDENDEEILEVGQDFNTIVNVPFNIEMIRSN